MSDVTLGTGLSLLGRNCGLTSDRLVSARVVTADGSVCAVDGKSDASLFWALRGGGGDIAVVTELTMTPRHLAAVRVAWMVFDLGHASSVLAELVAHTVSMLENLSWLAAIGLAPDGQALPRELVGRPVLWL